MHIRFILVETSLAANIGASARALKVMGFDDLHLVTPLCDVNHQDAHALASGASDVLQAAKIHTSLLDAIKGCHWVMGLTARDREFSPINLSSEAVKGYLEQTNDIHIESPMCAIVLGNERRGLTHEQLMHCSHRIFISANPNYSSLNLAQALQIMTYELKAFSAVFASQTKQLTANETIATKETALTQDALLAMHAHVLQGLQAINYYDGYSKLPEKLLQFWQKQTISQDDVHMWRGIAKAMLQTIKPK